MRQSYCVDCLCPPCMGLTMHTTHLDNSFKIFYFRIIIVALFYEYVCFACMRVCIPGASRGSDEGIGTPRTGTTDGCELSCVCMGILTQVVCRAMCAYPLSCFSSAPHPTPFYLELVST